MTKDGFDSESWHLDWGLPPELEIVAQIPLPALAAGNACILRGRIDQFLQQDPVAASISFLLEGDPIVHRRSGGEVTRQQLTAGGFGISPSGVDVAFRTEGFHESLNIALPDAAIQDFARVNMGYEGPHVELMPILDGRTPEIVSLGMAFARVVRKPRQGVALYAETLWTQIALQILWHHSSIPAHKPAASCQPLSDQRVAEVLAYLDANLGRDTSLSELAVMAELSPSYFLRAFKKATGRTPHAYRMDLRIARACELLRDPALPVTDIAAMLGFSSPSHFSTAFRRCRGTAPKAFRDSLGGRNAGAG